MQHILDFLNTPVIGGPGKIILYDNVPDGWQHLADLTFSLASALGGTIYVTKICVDKGLLRFEGSFVNSTQQEIFDKFAQAVARDSSTLCMECGNRGFRRKEEEFWPSLCGVHYVEYVNFLDSKSRE